MTKRTAPKPFEISSVAGPSDQSRREFMQMAAQGVVSGMAFSGLAAMCRLTAHAQTPATVIRVAFISPGPRRLRRRACDFQWKDYRAKLDARYKLMTLGADEFIRRFLIHVLPDGFHRIRTTVSSPTAHAPRTSRERVNYSTYRCHRMRAVMLTAPATVSRRHSRILALAAALA